MLDLSVPDSIFGFHARGAIEKSMKALIAARGETFAWTHDLESLQQHLARLREALPATAFPLKDLQEYASHFRYGGVPSLGEEKRVAIRELVRTLRGEFERRIGALQREP